MGEDERLQVAFVDFEARETQFWEAEQSDNLVIPAKAHCCAECFGVVP